MLLMLCAARWAGMIIAQRTAFEGITMTRDTNKKNTAQLRASNATNPPANGEYPPPPPATPPAPPVSAGPKEPSLLLLCETRRVQVTVAHTLEEIIARDKCGAAAFIACRALAKWIVGAGAEAARCRINQDSRGESVWSGHAQILSVALRSALDERCKGEGED